jgi:hypothetical protein
MVAVLIKKPADNGSDDQPGSPKIDVIHRR